MDVGIGLPSTIPSIRPGDLVTWARRSEERGFTSLGVIDRLVYGNYEPLTALAAAGAVTERIKLLTSILIVPFRASAAVLAKQAATVDHLSGGRLVLGVAVGGREDDFEAAGVPFADRGKRFDEMLAEMRRIWAGEPRGTAGAIGPTPPGGPVLLLGGTAEASFRRAAEYGAGWIAGGGGPELFAQAAERARAAWAAAGREGAPRVASLSYFSLGPDARRHADGYLRDYYGFLGPYADRIAAGALTDAGAVRDAVDQFRQAGCDELVLFPCNPDPGQVDLLADAIGVTPSG
jgi:alkanesulfonate monooxygenase SsuD/methylene tetrahydromethanopterin reductase-like flavin-dependent oxidoreductase (luciferase family)